MNPRAPYVAVLTCHPDAFTHAVLGIETRIWWARQEALALSYVLKGDLAFLRIPPPGPTRRADRLWEHTCFEAFVGMKDKPEYYEFNFAPSGEWAVFAFRGYRDGDPIEDPEFAPKIDARKGNDGLEVDVVVSLAPLRMTSRRARLRIGLSAVVEEESGALSYWALRHIGGKPDFHHPEAFALEIGPATGESLRETAESKR